MAFQLIHRGTRFRLKGGDNRIYKVVEPVGTDQVIHLRAGDDETIQRCYQDLIELDYVVRDQKGNVINRSVSLFCLKNVIKQTGLKLRQVELQKGLTSETRLTIHFVHNFVFITEFENMEKAKRFVASWRMTRNADLIINGVFHGPITLRHPAFRNIR